MARSGQITVDPAGTAVQGPNESGSLFSFAAHPDNVGVTWVGDDGGGDVNSATGYPLFVEGESVTLEIGNLNLLWFDAAEGGDVIAWIKLQV